MDFRRLHGTELDASAAAANRSLLRLSLNWLLPHTPTSSIILGASRQEQLIQNLAASDEGPLDSDTRRSL
ncbi:MAG: aldo/keto reductase [Acidobacteriota bacterium]